MSKLQIIHIAFVFGCLSLINHSTLSQDLVSEGVDTITVGSKVIYKVIPDPNVANNPNNDPSVFNWFFTDNIDSELNNGIVVDEMANINDTVLNDSINVLFDANIFSPVSIIKIKTQEIAQPKTGPACSGDIVELPIQFVPTPTVSMNTGLFGGCGIETATIELTINGYGPYDVVFNVDYNSSGSPVQFVSTIGNVSDRGGVNNLVELEVNTATHMTNGAGLYEIEIIDIIDRFSQKSTLAISGIVNSGIFTVGVNPEATATPIRHIRNL